MSGECRIVQGSVTIVNLDRSAHHVNETNPFANVSFPHLTEITDYLIVSDVSGLVSLSQLFPSLTRIGGRNLFNNFSLVIHENLDLEEIGLSLLRNISKGAVRIDKNEKLCYVDTVDWDQIVDKEFHDRNVMRVSHPEMFLST